MKIEATKHQEIIDKYINGETTYGLGKLYGVSEGTIRNILTLHNIQRRRSGFAKQSDGITQKCTMCQQDYPLTTDFFNRVYKKEKNIIDIRGKEILHTICRKCQSAKSKLYREKNKDKIKQTALKNHSKNLPTIIRYRQSHKAERSQYISQRLKTDKQFKIGRHLRRSLLAALKRQSSNKAYKTTELLGCTISDLFKYLESKFLTGMTWENHGLHGWHIDHILPCAFFNLTNADEQKKCFHYTNLQPLWAENNLHKNSIVNGIRITYKNKIQ
jgi:hypothetical protein